MTARYDAMIIGAGTAARAAAVRIRAAGRTVGVADHRPLGGTCALRGCDPKKMLIGGTSAVDHAMRMRGQGVTGDLRIDWPRLIDFKSSFTDPVPAKQERMYQDKGIDVFHGQARFSGPGRLDIQGVGVHARHIVIATGAEAVRLGIPGEELLVTSEQFLTLPALPPSVVLVGGGYIAAEFSTILALAGSKVTVLQRGPQMLKGFEPELVGWLMERFEKLGIDVRANTTVTRVDRVGDDLRISATFNDEHLTFDAALGVHAAGRAPEFDSLGLGAAGVELNDARLKLNDFLQSTSNPAVYAAGDAARKGPPLTPVSSHDGKVVATNILNGNQAKPDYRGVPSVAFTQPPLAKVGLLEEEARLLGMRFRVKSERTDSWFTARQAAEPTYGYKTLVEEGTERLLGAHLVGPHADEVINVFGLAIRHGLTVSDLKTTMFAYPTGASDIGYML